MQPKSSPFIERNPALEQADTAAEKAMRWCLRKLRLKSVPLPIPMDVWIERPMGLRLDITDLSMFGEGTEGNTNMAEYEVQIDQTLLDDDCRFRFACAHEVGHMLLHQNATRVFRDRTHMPRTLLDIHESQADRFAASFLMPVQSMFDRLFWLADQRRTEHVKFIDCLMADGDRSESLWASCVIPDLQATFGIGVQHVINRLASLHMRKGRRDFLSYSLATRLRRRFAPGPQSATRAETSGPDRGARGAKPE